MGSKALTHDQASPPQPKPYPRLSQEFLGVEWHRPLNLGGGVGWLLGPSVTGGKGHMWVEWS